MGCEYGFGQLEDRLITLFRSGAPDFPAAEELINQGVNLNASGKEPDENILSEILQAYWFSQRGDELHGVCENCEGVICNGCEHNKNPHLGESMIEIIKFFLDHGFDVHANDDKYGAQCLSSLVLSTFDEYALIATKLLFDAGARNVCIEESERNGETPWNSVGFEGIYQDYYCHNYHLGNIYEAIYQVYQAIDDGKPYAGIDTYMAALGKRVESVLSEKPESGEVFYRIDLPEFMRENCYRETLYFIYDGGMLINTKYASLWTDTVLPDKPLVDVSSAFPGIVGQTIRQISFEHNEIVKGLCSCGQPVIIIEMDSGAKLKLSTNFGEVEEENRAAYFTLDGCIQVHSG